VKKIRTLVVDDHIIIRRGLKDLLEDDDNIEIIGEAGSGFEALKILEETLPDIILMDVVMPGMSGIETVRIISKKYPGVKIIMLTIYDDDQYVRNAIESGAHGYVLKKVKQKELIEIIHNVYNDKAFIDPSLTNYIFNQIKKIRGGKTLGSGRANLTERELEIVEHLIEGLTDRNVSEHLNLSIHTVRTHIKNIYRKIGVSNRAQLVTYAIEKRIINYSKK